MSNMAALEVTATHAGSLTFQLASLILSAWGVEELVSHPAQSLATCILSSLQRGFYIRPDRALLSLRVQVTPYNRKWHRCAIHPWWMHQPWSKVSVPTLCWPNKMLRDYSQCMLMTTLSW